MRHALNAAFRRLPTWPVWVVGALPAFWLTFQLFTGGLGADPVAVFERRTGLWGLRFLLAALVVTPLLQLFGLNLVRFRRALGVLGFCYIALHLLAWVVLDKELWWQEILRDLVKRPFITVGIIALILLVPLAVTSTDSAIRRLGARRWQRLHRLAYPATILGALHYVLVVKGWPIEPLLYLTAAVGLVLIRVIRPWVRRAPVAAQAGASTNRIAKAGPSARL